MQFFDSPASLVKGRLLPCGVRVGGLHGRFTVAGSRHGGQRAGRPTLTFPDFARLEFEAKFKSIRQLLRKKNKKCHRIIAVAFLSF
jgi:hypothetical protein